MIEAVRTSETSVHFNVTTRRYIPEDSKLHTRRRENLKSHYISFLQTTAYRNKINQQVTVRFSAQIRHTETHYCTKFVDYACIQSSPNIRVRFMRAALLRN
jgi:hypothetical protein